MNKEVASILKQKIAGLPFLDRVAGLVQVVEDKSMGDDDKVTGIRKKFPVSDDVAGPDCTGREKDLVPNTAFKSITYFEDYGTTVTKNNVDFSSFQSKLRLICWLNRDRLVGDAYAQISSYCIASLIGRLSANQNANFGQFLQLYVKPITVPAQDAALFGRYSYDETVRQYLRPPFEFFGIDLVCTYNMSAKCLNTINFNIDNNC